jgi:CheY-like chemotaxis protein
MVSEILPGSENGKKILLMDDDPIVQMVVEKLLTKKGYQVQCTQSGEETIARYREALTTGNLFYLVMIDLTIHEGMGGVEAVQEIKKLDPQSRTVVFSGYTIDPVVDEFWKYGFDGVLKKPFSIEQFEKMIVDLA